MGRRPDPPATGGSPPTGPASFLAAAALAARLDDLTHHTDRLRHDSDQRRT
ncbi:hypothetical protein ACIOJE_18795 [Kitasatospora sp. NPDC087861]|uniref:hypothetical protein n=1 Tax=Kitasatospora sp. NPDC087861 TaxID=3364070 RepID=UPI0037FE5763